MHAMCSICTREPQQSTPVHQVLLRNGLLALGTSVFCILLAMQLCSANIFSGLFSPQQDQVYYVDRDMLPGASDGTLATDLEISYRWIQLLVDPIEAQEPTWHCPCSPPGLTLSRMIYSVSRDFPCARLVTLCYTNETFAGLFSAWISQFDSPLNGPFVCPGQATEAAPITQFSLDALYMFCAFVRTGITAEVPVLGEVVNHVELQYMAEKALNDRMMQMQHALMGDRTDNQTLALNAVFYSLRQALLLIDWGAYNQSSKYPADALDALGWRDPLEVWAKGNTDLSATPASWYRCPLNATSDEQRWCLDRHRRAWFFLYLRYYCNPVGLCFRTVRKSGVAFITEIAGQLGGVSSLVFVFLVPALWGLVVMPCGRKLAGWRDKALLGGDV